MEVSALKHSGVVWLHGRSPLLRLQSDERLVALIRRGNHAAFETLVSRYQSRLLAFVRHMLGSREDAEDVLQDVFASAYNAMLADEREINVRPWLYRIARNRALNHLRRVPAVPVETMDTHFHDHGRTTAEEVQGREDLRLLVEDVGQLPESQRTALVLRELDHLPYEQIAEVMDTTVSSVKSLLVRARVGLAEMAEARALTCEDVRLELGEIAEGLRRRATPPVRRHLKTCTRCAAFRDQLRDTNRALAAVFPVGAVLIFKNALLAKLGMSAGAGSQAGGAAAAGGGAATAGAVAAAGSGAAGGGLTILGGGIAIKIGAGLAATALVTAGAVEVERATTPRHSGPTTAAAVSPAPAPVLPFSSHAHIVAAPALAPHLIRRHAVRPEHPAATAAPEHGAHTRATPSTTAAHRPATPATTTPATTTPLPTPPPATTTAQPVSPGAHPTSGPTQTESDTTSLPSSPDGSSQSGTTTASPSTSSSTSDPGTGAEEPTPPTTAPSTTPAPPPPSGDGQTPVSPSPSGPTPPPSGDASGTTGG